MRKFIEKLLPSYTPPQISQKGDLAVIRERVFQTLVLALDVLWLIGIIILVIFSQPRGDWRAILPILILYLLFAALTSQRQLSFTIRGVASLAILLLGGILTLLSSGPAGISPLFFLMFAIFTALVFRKREAIRAWICLPAVFVLTGVIALSGWISPLSAGQSLYQASLKDWITNSLFLTIITGVLVLSLSTIVDNLEKSLASQQILASELENQRINLETHIQERTKEIERLSQQIRSTAEISRAISSILDPQLLLQNVIELIQKQFNCYYVGLFLVDEQGEYAILRAGTGEAGQKMIAQGHRLRIGGSSMIGWAVANRQPRIALDVGTEAIRFSNPYLPNTRSEIAIPIISRTAVLGAITIQSEQPNAFGENDVVILQSIVNSLAIALENARLFEQSQRDLEEIRSLNQQFLQRSWSEVISIMGGLTASFENPGAKAEKDLHPIRIPVILRDQTIAEITLEISDEGSLQRNMPVIEAIASQTALALESARLLEETQRRAAQEEKINQLSAQLSRGSTVESILKTALTELGHLPSVAEVSVHLISPSRTRKPATDSSRDNGHHKEQNL